MTKNIHTNDTNVQELFICAVVTAVLLMPHVASALEIKNTVNATARTGGVTVVNGTDGSDGEDGRDGANGADGASVSNNARSSVHVKTIIDGEVVTDIHEIEEESDTAAAYVGVMVAEPVDVLHDSDEIGSIMHATATVSESPVFPTLLGSLRSLLFLVTQLF